MTQKTAEYEEQLEALLNKCSALEKAKSRLQSEVEVLVMDLEKVIASLKENGSVLTEGVNFKGRAFVINCGSQFLMFLKDAIEIDPSSRNIFGCFSFFLDYKYFCDYYEEKVRKFSIKYIFMKIKAYLQLKKHLFLYSPLAIVNLFGIYIRYRPADPTTQIEGKIHAHLQGEGSHNFLSYLLQLTFSVSFMLHLSNDSSSANNN